MHYIIFSYYLIIKYVVYISFTQKFFKGRIITIFMHVLVTGGSGFIGKPLVRALANSHDVVVFGREDDIDRPDNVELITGDVKNKVSLRRAFALRKFDIVYHLAASQDEDDPRLFDVNVKGTENVVELCGEERVKQLIFISTAGVLGDMKSPANERNISNPKTKYDKSKMHAESIIKNSGLSYTIIRVPVVIGPNLFWSHVIESIKNGHPLIGDGSNKMHLAYVDDVVSMLVAVLGNEKAYSHIFHVASKDIMTYREVYNIICRELGIRRYKRRSEGMAKLIARIHKAKSAVRLAPQKPHLSTRYLDMVTRNWALSIKKAKDRLGFEPMYTTPAAIHETIKRL